jgi:hypothetical protein
MRSDGIRISLRSAEHTEIEIGVEQDPDTNEYGLWLFLEGPHEVPCAELTAEEARALAGTLNRLADDLGRHLDWQGLNAQP